MTPSDEVTQPSQVGSSPCRGTVVCIPRDGRKENALAFFKLYRNNSKPHQHCKLSSKLVTVCLVYHCVAGVLCKLLTQQYVSAPAVMHSIYSL